MQADIQQKLKALTQQFDVISESRKLLLQKIAVYVQKQINLQQNVNLVYICTHNSRRSHFGQIAAAIASEYYNLPNVVSYSGGTEVTAFNENAIKAVEQFGFLINKLSDGKNPRYEVVLSKEKSIFCFSKKYDDGENPTRHFAAIMVCTDAEQNCPFVAGADVRIATPYNDPKEFDNTPQQEAAYSERFQQILLETLYAFSLVK